MTCAQVLYGITLLVGFVTVMTARVVTAQPMSRDTVASSESRRSGPAESGTGSSRDSMSPAYETGPRRSRMKVVETIGDDTSYFSIVGAVQRSGVYTAQEPSISIGRLVRAAGGTSDAAGPHILVVKNGGRPVRLFARDPAQSEDILFSRDVVIVVPSSENVRTGGDEPQSQTVPVACLGLTARPVVLPLAREIRTKEELVGRLQQPASLTRHVQVIDPHGRTATNQLVAGTVLVFDSRFVDRTPLASTEAFPPAVPLVESSTPDADRSVQPDIHTPAPHHAAVTRRPDRHDESGSRNDAGRTPPRTLHAPSMVPPLTAENDDTGSEVPVPVNAFFQPTTGPAPSEQDPEQEGDRSAEPPAQSGSRNDEKSPRREAALSRETETEAADGEGAASFDGGDHAQAATGDASAPLPAAARTGSSNLLVLGAIGLLIATGAGVSVLWSLNGNGDEKASNEEGSVQDEADSMSLSDSQNPTASGIDTVDPSDSTCNAPSADSTRVIPDEGIPCPDPDHRETGQDETPAAPAPAPVTIGAVVPGRLAELLNPSLPVIEEPASLPENLVLHGEAVGHRRIILHEAHPALTGMHFRKPVAQDSEMAAVLNVASGSPEGPCVEINRVSEQVLRQQLRAVFASGGAQQRRGPETVGTPGAAQETGTSPTAGSVRPESPGSQYDCVLPEDEAHTSHEGEQGVSPASHDAGALDRALQRLARENWP